MEQVLIVGSRYAAVGAGFVVGAWFTYLACCVRRHPLNGHAKREPLLWAIAFMGWFTMLSRIAAWFILDHTASVVIVRIGWVFSMIPLALLVSSVTWADYKARPWKR